MASAFHWIKVKAICYATENEDLIHDTMMTLTGTEDFDVDVSEGMHGNPMIIIDAELTHSKDFKTLFINLGPEIIQELVSEAENRIDDDCTLYFRIDKQKAVEGVYEIAHGGDVISITAKVASHPAKKEIAVKNLKDFLASIPAEKTDRDAS